ncbi:hypothetical protein PGTUg99_032086 [Puccinia graminis f. sp. tritici]|uniref:Uncharacterized protein n=1 Tax=Puccinia graminis f. sp. tritici TaxID=56615 RepID=A0A5B0LUE0_PUCGR|nr:hypothetical protein PGTUg99_032086 [Puccinia graminis f. sp. tritici]
MLDISKIKTFLANGNQLREPTSLDIHFLRGYKWNRLLSYNAAARKFMRYKITVKETPFFLPILAGDLYGFCYWAGKNTDEYDTQDICFKTLAKYLYGLQAWHLYHSVEYPKESKAKVAVLLRASAHADAEAPPKPVKAPVTITQLVALTNHLVLEMVEGYPSRIPVIRWRIPASANGYPPTGADGPFSTKSWRVSGYPKGYLRPEGEMAGWKETLPAGKVLVDWKGVLPAGEVLVPCRPEGCPSSRRGTCTLSTGRVSFQSTRYLYLDGWKEALPAGPLEGGYPRIPATIPAAADGYPPAGSDAQMAGKSSQISASARISGCQSTIST